MSKQWFDVSKKGLGKQAEEYGKGRLVGELIQNPFDEPGVTMVDVVLEMIPGKKQARLVVEDDCPAGFADLTHAYTLFAESKKRANPEQRGQFNFGEKLVLSACYEATISTTKGTVVFDDKKGRLNQPSKRRERGSVFEGRIRMTKSEFDDVILYIQSLLLPSEIALTFNGELVEAREPIHTFSASLQTPICDEDNVMRIRNRKTTVRVYETLPEETPTLYEMGLPVVELGDKWHICIDQKLPVNRDRNNVPPSYQRRLRTLLVNELHDRLEEEDANQPWVRQASPHCSDDAIQRILDLRFGSKRAAYDMSDPEANKKFVSKGGTIVHGSMLSKDEWKRAKEAGAIEPAGKICPTQKAYSNDPNAPEVEIVPRDKWTEGMTRIVEYARFLGHELLKVPVEVVVVNTTNNFLAAYIVERHELHFNVKHLGWLWFEQGITPEVDALLIHEFGHEYCGDHFNSRFYDALCDIGAKLKQLAIASPEKFARFEDMDAADEFAKNVDEATA